MDKQNGTFCVPLFPVPAILNEAIPATTHNINMEIEQCLHIVSRYISKNQNEIYRCNIVALETVIWFGVEVLYQRL